MKHAPNAERCPCAVCGSAGAAGEMYIHARCHVASPLWLVIEPQRGTIRVECVECGAVVLRLPMQALADPA